MIPARRAWIRAIFTSAMMLPASSFGEGVSEAPSFRRDVNAAYLAQAAYARGEELASRVSDLTDGRFVVIDEAYNILSGFQAFAARDTEKGDIVIAYTGTNGPLDLAANADLANETLFSKGTLPFIPKDRISPNLDKQINEAFAFYEKTSAEHPGAHIWATGHSLGGLLGELTSAKYDLTGVVFSAPGAPDTLLDRHGIKVLQTFDIRSYGRVSDPVAQFGAQVGTMIHLKPHAAKAYATETLIGLATAFGKLVTTEHALGPIVEDIKDPAREDGEIEPQPERPLAKDLASENGSEEEVEQHAFPSWNDLRALVPQIESEEENDEGQEQVEGEEEEPEAKSDIEVFTLDAATGKLIKHVGQPGDMVTPPADKGGTGDEYWTEEQKFEQFVREYQEKRASEIEALVPKPDTRPMEPTLEPETNDPLAPNPFPDIDPLDDPVDPAVLNDFLHADIAWLAAIEEGFQPHVDPYPEGVFDPVPEPTSEPDLPIDEDVLPQIEPEVPSTEKTPGVPTIVTGGPVGTDAIPIEGLFDLPYVEEQRRLNLPSNFELAIGMETKPIHWPNLAMWPMESSCIVTPVAPASEINWFLASDVRFGHEDLLVQHAASALKGVSFYQTFVERPDGWTFAGLDTHFLDADVAIASESEDGTVARSLSAENTPTILFNGAVNGGSQIGVATNPEWYAAALAEAYKASGNGSRVFVVGERKSGYRAQLLEELVDAMDDLHESEVVYLTSLSDPALTEAKAGIVVVQDPDDTNDLTDLLLAAQADVNPIDPDRKIYFEVSDGMVTARTVETADDPQTFDTASRRLALYAVNLGPLIASDADIMHPGDAEMSRALEWRNAGINCHVSYKPPSL